MDHKLHITTATSDEELLQILDLQQRNLVSIITNHEKQKEGFVTVEHSFDLIKKMNIAQPHIIAKHNGRVIAYALSMTKDFAKDIPVLTPLFKKIDSLVPETQSYIVMGQICVEKRYRGHGVFRRLYKHMRSELISFYDLLITEVASDNSRSLQAHYAIGFTNLLIYQSDTIEWNIIQWDWK